MNIRKKIKEAFAIACQRRIVDGEETNIWETEPHTEKNIVYELHQEGLCSRYETLDENNNPRLMHTDWFTYEEFYEWAGYERIKEIADKKQALEEKAKMTDELADPQKEQKQKGAKRL